MIQEDIIDVYLVEKLMVHYESIGIKWGDVACNPMTDVVDILKELDVI